MCMHVIYTQTHDRVCVCVCVCGADICELCMSVYAATALASPVTSFFSLKEVPFIFTFL